MTPLPLWRVVSMVFKFVSIVSNFISIETKFVSIETKISCRNCMGVDLRLERIIYSCEINNTKQVKTKPGETIRPGCLSGRRFI